MPGRLLTRHLAPLAPLLILAAVVHGAGDERVLVPAGSVVRELASPLARPLWRSGRDTELPVLDRDGSWVRIADGERTGWVDLTEERGSPTLAAAAGQPTPTLLVTAPATVERWRAAARVVLGDHARTLTWGRFQVLTDLPTGPALDAYRRIAVELPALHAHRYGLADPGAPAPTIAAPAVPAAPAATPAAVLPSTLGTVVLFTREADYRAFTAATADRMATADLAGHATTGVAALPLGDRRTREATATLIHELAHLLNRRRLGNELPAWLDEGLAGELELIEVGDTGELFEERWAHGASELDGGRRPVGALVVLDRLLADAERRRLEDVAELIAVDRRALLVSPRRAELRALAALWVRFLLDDSERKAGFHQLLAIMAAAPPPTDQGAAQLAEALGVPLAELDRRFRIWLRDLARRR